MMVIRFLLLLGGAALGSSYSLAQEVETPTQSMGDAERGRIVFYRCQDCHSIDTIDKDKQLAPNLKNLFGRQAGTLDSYKNYSKVLKDANFVWDAEKLNEWLRDPNSFLPGNTMAFSGVLRQHDRDDLIAFLKQLSQTDKK